MGLPIQFETYLRSISRNLGMTPWIVKINRFFRGSGPYEERFSQALLAAVRSGDHVWDVGANVGFYTRQISELVGDTGSVSAFEPVRACYDAITGLNLPNVHAFNMALGDSEGTLPMTVSSDPLSTTNRLVNPSEDAVNQIDVRVTTGNAILNAGSSPAPNLVKVDVEGYEEEVLKGMTAVLARQECRAVFVEVHFGILDARGRRQAPAAIEQLLQSLGFETDWLDGSHISATKPA
ncbi:MAG: FkbM family methyltransferase [Isosphaerales bacterium]